MHGGGDGGIVEQAEAHGAARFGMVSWRTNGAKGVFRFAAQDGIDGADGAANAAQGRIETPGRHPCIGIELLQAVFGRSLADAFEMLLGMDAEDLRLAGERRLLAQQHVETGGRENAVEDFQPLGAFGMAFGRLMLDAERMSEQESCHGQAISRGARRREGRSGMLTPSILTQ